ncbi:efflux RND transporter periplasmic adaptor subunit [Methylocaldum sp. MU1018]
MRIVYLLVATVMFLLSACGKPGGNPGRAPSGAEADRAGDGPKPEANRTVRIRPESRPYVTVQVIAPKAYSGIISAPGRVDFRAKAISTAATVVAGRISKVHVQIGDRVKAGQPLATLISVEAAQMRSDFNRAKAELARDEDRYKRQLEMQRTGVGLEVERMEAETQLEEARSDFERSRDALRLLGDGVAEEVVVRAPMDSTVLRAHTPVGAAVQPGSALFDLGEPSALWIIADVFERDLLLVEKGAEADVEIASAHQPIKGHVVAESTALQTELRRASVFIEPDDPTMPLRPGMYARVAIKVAGPDSIVLPTEAVLIKDGKQTIVYVETDEGVFEPRNVLVGPARDGMTPVLDGLSGGERVVVSGALLIDGEAAMLL